MNTLNDVLTPLQTKIAFVSANNPGGGGGGTVPQTGDAISIVLAIIAALAVICVATYSIVTRQKIASARSVGIVDADISLMQKSRRRITLALSAVVAICLASLIWIYSPLHSAIAGTDGDVTGSDVVYAHVDETTGAVTVDDGVIVNNTKNDLYITSSTLKFVETDEDKITAPSDIKLSVTGLDSTLFNGSVGEKWTEKDGYIVLKTTLPAGKQTPLHFAISNLNVQDARNLIGQTAYFVELEEAPCYTINYFANGADEGSVPNVGIMKESDESIAIAGNTEGLDYWGFNYVGWNTKADGTGTDYNAGDVYTTKASLNLYAKWQEKANVNITYKVDPNHKGGKVKLLNSAGTESEDSVSESVAPRTGDPKGATIRNVVNEDYAFIGWYTESDEPLGNVKDIKPERNDHKCWEATTYVARFEKVVKANITGESEDVHRGSVVSEITKDIYTGSKYVVTTQGQDSIITIYDLNDTSKYQQIIASGEGDYKFDHWVYTDSKGTEHVVGSEGFIVGDMKFIAYFYSENEVDITISISEAAALGHQGAFTYDEGIPLPLILLEDIDSSQPSLAKLEAVVNPDDPFEHKFAYWEFDFNDGLAPVRVTEAEYTPTLSDLGKTHWGTDMTITCYFIAPTAIYTSNDSTMRFVYDKEYYPINGDNGQIAFPVIPDSYYNPDRKGDSNFPLWVNPDGTFKVYPRNIIFEESFKGYKELVSTSYWFSSQRSLFEMSTQTQRMLNDEPMKNVPLNYLDGDTQPRVIQNVEGLNNIYTENIIDTSYMFASRNRNDLPLESLDFSTWNLPNVQNMAYMFAGNLFLKDLKLPSDTEGHYFGTTAQNMSYMFCQCASLKSFECNGTFGQSAINCVGMFSMCKSLSEFNTGQYFGSNVVNTGAMFYNCSHLYEFTMGGTFGQLTQYTSYYDNEYDDYYGMFENCSTLRKVNFNNYFGKSLNDATHMFSYCQSLSSVDFTNFYLTSYYDPNKDYAAEMLYGCTSLMEIKVGTNFTYYFQGDEYYDNLGVEFDEWYVDDHGTQIYDAYELPLRSADPKHSVACTYRIRAPKAVYDKTQSTFTFTYDHTVYSAPDVEVYFVPSTSGFQAGNNSLMNAPAAGKSIGHAEPEKYNSNSILPPWFRFTGDDPVYELADSSMATRIDYLTSNDDQSMGLAMTLSKFECMVDAKTVKFKSSFAAYDKLKSTSLWFAADSYGKQSFQNFEGLINIPYKNIKTTACMFGGFSYEMMSSYYNWASMSQTNYVASYFERILDYILYQQGMAPSGMSSYKLDQLGSKYDTYGTSVRELDLSDFAPLVWGAKVSRPKLADLSALLANCCGLQKVILPEDEDYAYNDFSTVTPDWMMSDEDSNKDMTQNTYSLIFGEPNYSGGLNGFFLNCESLNTIENLPALFRHFNTVVLNGKSDRFYMIYRMFSGCRSLETVDLRDVPAFNIEQGANGPWIFQGLFENCDNLTTIYTYDGYNETRTDQSYQYVWNREFAVFGLPDFAEDDNPWTLYYRVPPQPPKLFGIFELPGTSVEDEAVEINGDDDYPIKYEAELTTVDIPYYQTATGPVYLAGKFVREKQDGYTLSFDVSDKHAGSIYYTNDNADVKTEVADMNFVTSSKYFVYGSELFVNGVGISAKAADGYKFNHWEINGQMISSYKDAGEITNINEDATFVACFDAEDLTPKAVYREDNGSTSLTFVYDNKTPAQIMAEDSTVLDVYIVNPNTYFENKYAASLPPWMKLVYKGKEGKLDVDDFEYSLADRAEFLARAYKLEDEVAYQANGNEKFAILVPGDKVIEADTWEDDRKFQDIGGNAYYLWNDHGFKEVIYNDSWHLEWAIQPESVIFDSSFKNYDGLESISGWFMADDNGLQPVKHFYSKDINGVKHDGDRAFENLNTTNIQDVKYAFGGISYPSGRDRISDTSAFGMILEDLSDLPPAPQPGFVSYGNSFETYGRSLTEINLKSFDMSNIKSLDYMFANALMLEKVIFPDPASGSTTILSNCKSMAGLFYQCESLKDNSSIVGLNKFDTSNVECMDAMFYSCSGLTSLDLTNFNTENLAYDNWHNADCYNPRTDDVNYEVCATQYTWGMFYECTRLAELKVNSKYDPQWWQRGNLTHIAGWTVNLCNQPCYGCLPNYYYGEDDNWWIAGNEPVYNTSYLPCELQIMESGIRPEDYQSIHTGRYYLDHAVEVYDVNFVVDEDDNYGTINGLQETSYSFVKTANIHMDPYAENTIWADNLLYVAEPSSDDYAFMYWTYGDGFGPLKGEIVQNNLMMHFENNNYEEVTFVAHFTNDLSKAKAVFTASNGQGNLKFVYDDVTYEPGKGGVLAVYNVNPNCNSYNLPAWYKFAQESGMSGDDHQINYIDSVIENNSPKGVTVTFDESFKNYDQLKSMSCWFIPCVSNADQNKLYVPFSTKPYVTTQSDVVEFSLDLSNVNTTSLEDFSYMFGGHDSVSDYGGTTLNKITLTMPEQFKTTKLDAWFANCVRLTDIDFTNDFDSSNVTSMFKMFYNCPNLVYKYPGSTVDLATILNNFNTSKVTDMSYMFAQTQTIYAMYNMPVDDPENPDVENTYDIQVNFPPSGGDFTTANVENFEGMFSGFYNAKTITITGDFQIKAENSEKGISMQFMFGHNPYLEQVNLPATFNTSKVKYMGGMFAGDYRLGYVAPAAGGDPDPTQFKMTSECIIVGNPASKNSLVLDGVIETAEMFSYCRSLKGFDLPKKRCTVVDGGLEGLIQDASYMFYDCSCLQVLNLTNYFITSNYVSSLRPYPHVTTSSVISGRGGDAPSAIAVVEEVSHPAYKLCSSGDLGMLDTLIIGSNSDTTDTYWLQWNTNISFFKAFYNNEDQTRLHWYESHEHGAISQRRAPAALNGYSSSWINKQTGHCVLNTYYWPVRIDNPSPALTGIENPFGTYLKQNVDILIHTKDASGHSFESVNGNEVNRIDFDSQSNLNFGYGNGFKASYTIESTPGDSNNMAVSFTFTSTEDNSISNTQIIEFRSETSNVYWSYQLFDSRMDTPMDASTSVTYPVDNQDISELFTKESITNPGYAVFWTNTENTRNYKNDILKDEFEVNANNSEKEDIDASADETESLEDALEASAAEASAFEELANTEEPVAEVATAALSLLSFTVPWEFFTMCLEIIF